jgi:hypothetical protein
MLNLAAKNSAKFLAGNIKYVPVRGQNARLFKISYNIVFATSQSLSLDVSLLQNPKYWNFI